MTTPRAIGRILGGVVIAVVGYYIVFSIQHPEPIGEFPSGRPGDRGADTSDNTGAGTQSTTTPPVLSSQPPSSAPCVVSGCSGEICADESMASACIYRPQFACYKTAMCERQANGVCGWTETALLRACVDQAQRAQGLPELPQ